MSHFWDWITGKVRLSSAGTAPFSLPLILGFKPIVNQFFELISQPFPHSLHGSHHKLFCWLPSYSSCISCSLLTSLISLFSPFFLWPFCAVFCAGVSLFGPGSKRPLMAAGLIQPDRTLIMCLSRFFRVTENRFVCESACVYVSVYLT